MSLQSVGKVHSKRGGQDRDPLYNIAETSDTDNITDMNTNINSNSAALLAATSPERSRFENGDFDDDDFFDDSYETEGKNRVDVASIEKTLKITTKNILRPNTALSDSLSNSSGGAAGGPGGPGSSSKGMRDHFFSEGTISCCLLDSSTFVILATANHSDLLHNFIQAEAEIAVEDLLSLKELDDKVSNDILSNANLFKEFAINVLNMVELELADGDDARLVLNLASHGHGSLVTPFSRNNSQNDSATSDERVDVDDTS